jgi:hypothetical protein
MRLISGDSKHVDRFQNGRRSGETLTQKKMPTSLSGDFWERLTKRFF